MKTAREILFCLLFACLIGVSVEAFLILRKADAILQDAKNVGKSVQNTMDEANAVVILARGTMLNVDLLLGRLEDASKKWQETSTKEAQYWRTLQERSLSTIDNLNRTNDTLRDLLAGTDRRLNGELIPALALAVGDAGRSTKEISASLGEIADKSGKNLDDLHVLLSSPEWKEILESINRSAESLDASMNSVKQAATEVPSVAQSVEKMAKTSNKYHKAIILAQIASLIGRIFF